MRLQAFSDIIKVVLRLFYALLALCLASCVAIAGVSDFAVDPCFNGCGDGATSDGPGGDTTTIGDGGPDSSSDADASPLRSPGKSFVTVLGTGVSVGKTIVVKLTTKDDAGNLVARTGSKVVFKTSGGTSVVSMGAVVDKTDGTYRTVFTGVTVGTKIDVTATLDGAPLTTAPAKLRVINPVFSGLTFSIEAANADGAGHFGGRNCAASGLTQWTDLTSNAEIGALSGFGDTCAAGSGWEGNGSPESPFRLAFDGINDHVDFGAVNALPQYTVLAWIRKQGVGFTATSGPGGLTLVTPIVTKGTAEGSADATDINYFLGIASTGVLASDYDESPGSANAPMLATTVIALDTWYMVGMTLDYAAGQRSLWVDGVAEASAVPALPPAGAASSLLVIGGAKPTTAVGSTCPGPMGSTGCGRFKGEIGGVLTYDRVLTAGEIARNCHAYSSRYGMLGCAN